MYWLLPLFFLAVAIAVIPVLYGTLKHKDWEEREAALKECQQAQLTDIDVEKPSLVREPPVHAAVQDARAEAVALLRRIEHLAERVGGEAEGEAMAEEARPLASAGRRNS